MMLGGRGLFEEINAERGYRVRAGTIHGRAGAVEFLDWHLVERPLDSPSSSANPVVGRSFW